MKYLTIILLLISTSCDMRGMILDENDQTKTIFQQLNLDYPGLEKVKVLVDKKEYKRAAEALLKYYKGRTAIRHPEFNREDKSKYLNKNLPEKVFEKANKGLEHLFFVHKGYGFLNYGKDINWQYWPVKDNEIRWQVNRMYWWIPMGLAYWSTGDEKYAKEWIFQYRDWVKKNPMGLSKENDHFAWRPLETSRRIQDQTSLFNMFVNSPNFDAEFLMDFLENYYRHAEHVLQNYSEKGNHLLFEAQRIIYAGSFFPEFKRAKVWRTSGITILNKEIEKQVYPDGLQYELSPNYHTGAINTFIKAYNVAMLANVAQEFPESYMKNIEKMIMALANFSFPDYSYPMFSDAKLENKENMIEKYQSWQKYFPDNEVIRYYATNGEKGMPLPYLSHALKDGGFYTFRNSWKDTATVLVLKASPPAFWHSQPDNGTFDLWVKGRNFMPDAGAYVYGGNAEIMKKRNWYRQTMVHKTLTLDNANLDVCDATLHHWKTSANLDLLSYTNPSYKGLNHTRTVLFIDKKYFVIFDKAEGDAEGNVAIHFQFKEGKATLNKKNHTAYTKFSDGNNLLIQNFNLKHAEMMREKGKVSYAYKREVKRPAFAFNTNKVQSGETTFTTILYPFQGKKPPKIEVVENKNNEPENGIIDLTITIDNRKHQIKKTFEIGK